jgi:heme-degrading monooxygenase HmoA
MLVSLTIVRYKPLFVPLAFMSMALHRLPLILDRNCSLWKLMGSGKNGTFDLKPDYKQWALLAAWKDQHAFDSFRESSFISSWWKTLCTETYTVLCTPITSHGSWDKKNPFTSSENIHLDGPVAVLTRATIRFKRLKNFWQNVDKVAGIMTGAKGYITSFGIGEAPFFRQATFSVWESLDDVKAFAYRSPEHRDVIQKTRDENWYSEELFARFKPLATFGTLNGKDPLAGKI